MSLLDDQKEENILKTHHLLNNLILSQIISKLKSLNYEIQMFDFRFTIAFQ